jgi:hypothetical protein
MKCFLLGALGAILILIGSAFLWAQYSDYTARAQTSGWLNQVTPLQDSIERFAIENSSLTGVTVKYNAASLFTPMNLDLVEVASNGTIALRGGSDGQFLVLIPSLAGGKVTWRCLGGSAKAMTYQCRKGETQRVTTRGPVAADVDIAKIQMLRTVALLVDDSSNARYLGTTSRMAGSNAYSIGANGRNAHGLGDDMARTGSHGQSRDGIRPRFSQRQPWGLPACARQAAPSLNCP